MTLVKRALVVALLAVAGCDAPHSPTLSGTLTMPDELQQRLAESDTLFIILEKPGQEGPPFAVKRMVGVKFPLDYTFDQQDMLEQGKPFAGPVNVRARINKSGIANVGVPGDVTGIYPKNPAKVGDTDVDFALDQVVR